MQKTILSLVLVFISTAFAFPQATDKPDPAAEEAKLKENAVEFLRETMGDVATLRTPENRISFTAEMASLMWFHDENEARAMYSSVIADFREILSSIETQLKMLPSEEPELSGGPFSPFGQGRDRMRIAMKYRMAQAVRKQIAKSMAEHDPELAINFFYDTANTFTDPSLKARYSYFDSDLEFDLLDKLAAKNPSKAVRLAARSFEHGIRPDHIDLLHRLADKDPDKGAEFGALLLSKIENVFSSPGASILGSLLEFGFENREASTTSGKRAVYSENDLRTIADLLATSILEGKDFYAGVGYLPLIERFQPGRAIQIKAKIKANKKNGTRNFTVVTDPPPAISDDAGKYRVTDKNSTPNPAAVEKASLEKDFEKVGKGELPKEERDKIIARSRAILSRTVSPLEQITGLSMLAANVAQSGDKVLADEIMRDAEALVKPFPRNYADYMLTWTLASGYAEVEPDKAFPIIEGLIMRLNDLIEAFASVGEFIDVDEELLVDGELQVGSFGGGMMRDISSVMAMTQPAVAALARADLAKLRALTNRFQRPEARILAKMIVLRSVLGNEKEAQTKQDVGGPISTPITY